MKVPYDQIAKEWDSVRVDFRPGEEQFFNFLTKNLPPSAHILDLGCGTGKPIDVFLTENGHIVTGIDQSLELLKIARTNLPDCTYIHYDIFAYTTDQNFDCVVLWDAIFHIERDHHKPLLEKIYSILKTPGLLIFTSGGSVSERFDDTMFDNEFSYDSHTPKDLHQILESIGFKIELSELIEKPDGDRNRGRLGVIVKK